jgi:dsDNA-binding SOS-regulon protein
MSWSNKKREQEDELLDMADELQEVLWEVGLQQAVWEDEPREAPVSRELLRWVA